MVVDPEVDVSIVPPLVAATLSDHEQSRGLSAPPVPARRVAREQRRQEPVAQVALRLCEHAGQLGNDGLADEDVPLRGEPASRSRRPPMSMHLDPVNVADATGRSPRIRPADPHGPRPPRGAGGGRRRPRRLRPSGRDRPDRSAVFAQDCVATAPTPALAHGTTAPTHGNLDATATPQSPASRIRGHDRERHDYPRLSSWKEVR